MDRPIDLIRLFILIFLLQSFDAFGEVGNDIEKDAEQLNAKIIKIEHIAVSNNNKLASLKKNINELENKAADFERNDNKYSAKIDVLLEKMNATDSINTVMQTVAFVIAFVTVIFTLLTFSGIQKWNELNRNLKQIKEDKKKFNVWRSQEVYLYEIHDGLFGWHLGKNKKRDTIGNQEPNQSNEQGEEEKQKAKVKRKPPLTPNSNDSTLYTIKVIKFLRFLRSGDENKIRLASVHLPQLFNFSDSTSHQQWMKYLKKYLLSLEENGFLQTEKCRSAVRGIIHIIPSHR